MAGAYGRPAPSVRLRPDSTKNMQVFSVQEPSGHSGMLVGFDAPVPRRVGSEVVVLKKQRGDLGAEAPVNVSNIYVIGKGDGFHR